MILSKKARLLRLRTKFAWDIAQAKQEGFQNIDLEEELATLSMMQVSDAVANALNEDLEYRSSPEERADALMAVLAIVFKGVEALHKEEASISYMLGIHVQSELEKILRGKTNDRDEED